MAEVAASALANATPDERPDAERFWGDQRWGESSLDDHHMRPG